ncbi:MAG: S8/S53 family peptidase [Flavobacteriaceae bacterium]|nr:S8/S53 family peptidase [Flavobacteriaceae bacterium]
MNKLFIFLLTASFSIAFAQETDLQALQKLSQQFQLEYEQNQIFIENRAAEKGMDAAELKKYLVGKIGNQLVYIDNLDQSQQAATNVDLLYNNALPGVAVTGLGMTVYQWDGGRVDAGSNEMTGRVTNMEDTTSPLSDHATGVAGIMIASGIAPSAQGMAPDADVIAYDYNNNFNEMSLESANNQNYMISNHSYGYQAGWRYGEYDAGLGEGWYWFGFPSLGENESALHGVYTQADGYLDQISRAAPFHLIIKAAGNDRNQGPNFPTEHAVLDDNNEWTIAEGIRPKNCAQTGYDCIPYGAMAKNILTVGSVNPLAGNGRYTGPQSVVASGFSAFGPTDDGRIKPEIVAQGAMVTIPMNNNTYYTSSGTSLSTPSISGIALLLQQLYHQINGNYLNSASLKALLLNTTNEVGLYPGPDYRFGFGLADAFKAASLVVDEQNNDAVIMSGIKMANPINIGLEPIGNQPIRATLVWMDPVPSIQNMELTLNDRTPMLVNDLDMRITDNISFTEHMPWVLDVENPADAAIRADNVLDNVEQILIDNPAQGSHTLTITHKNSLRGLGQHYALVISGARLANTSTNDVVSKNLNIYPNPTKDILHINGLTGKSQIQIINMDGRIIQNESMESNNINVSHLETGSYILLISTDGVTTAKKFIKK